MDDRKKLKEKATDYQNFSHILLAASTFFYLGLLIKGNEQTNTHLAIIMIATLIFISLAFLFRTVSVNCRKKLIEMEDDINELNH
ncbi:YrhC family protein [Bacillus kwashiorkori]|uniref:YrhC family protein n=1 Tax=Bacillus kwashiorkori TaxID=1522318 RepID=UPI0007823701|nr:YrhC family protein [Bacillus kwashiorkori]